MATLELITKVAVEGQEKLRGLQESTLAIGAGMIAAGGAIEAFNRNQQESTVQIRQLSERLGEQEDAVRKWATEMTDAGFPLEDAIDLMDLAARRGLEGKDAIQGYARFWDTVADATGEASVGLAEAGIALQQIGISAGNEEEAVAAFGYVMENTTDGVSAFLDFISRTGPELQAMGATVDDAAQILGILENELGMSGRVARQEFNAAIKESDGTLQGLYDVLGITDEQLARTQESFDSSADAIQRNADIANEAYTPMQQFQAAIGDILFENAQLIESLGGLSMILMAGGPIVMGFKGVAAAFGALKVVLLANPFVALAAAVVAIVALIVLNWDHIVEFVKGVVSAITGAFRGLASALGRIWDGITSTVKRIWDGIVGAIKGAINSIISIINRFIGFINGIKINIPSFQLGPISTPAINWGGLNIPTIPLLAEGGIVNGATLAILGERGPEAVIPLDKMGAMGDTNVTLNIYGDVQGDERRIPGQVLRALYVAGA